MVRPLSTCSRPNAYVAACIRAGEYGVYNYKVIEQIINNKLDRIQSRPEITAMPTHANIRGAEYYH